MLIESPPPIEASWRREALFNGMTSTAFQLGTILTGGWFWVRRRGCIALYSGAAPAQIDVSRILHVAGAEARELSLPSHLSPPAGSARCYLVRRFNACGCQEQTTAAVVVVRLTPDGQWEPPAPNAVLDLQGEEIPNHKIRLVWSYCPLDQATPPERFNLYWDGGTGQIDVENPLATIPYQGRRSYRYDSGVLDEGRYTFAVRAASVDGTENMTAPTVTCPLLNLPIEPVSIVAAQSI
jgi:hypothetical protein